MVEISRILAGMVTAIQSQKFPAGSEIASALELDLSGATITTTHNGLVSILGAHLPASTTEIELWVRQRRERPWISFSSGLQSVSALTSMRLSEPVNTFSRRNTGTV